MARIGLFYGSTEGATARVAAQIAGLLGDRGHAAELFDIGEFYLAEMTDFQYLILGIPTWDVGQLQADWDEAIDELDELDLTGATVAIFGLGDQRGYPATFADAMLFLADRVVAQGARLVGRWPTTGYTFQRSWAVVDGDFVGVVLDELNQPELTRARLERWLTIVLAEFGI